MSTSLRQVKSANVQTWIVIDNSNSIFMFLRNNTKDENQLHINKTPVITVHGHCVGCNVNRNIINNRNRKHMFRGSVSVNSNRPERRGSALLWVWWGEKTSPFFFLKKHNLSLHLLIAIQVMPSAVAPTREAPGEPG